MKGLYRLLNLEFGKWIVFAALLCAAAILAPLFLLYGQLESYSAYTVNERYENVYVSAGGVLLFGMFVALACAYFLVTVYADYWGSKSVYTYLSLPVRREALYLSKLGAFAICLLLLLAAQLIGIRLGYALYAAKVGSYEGGHFLMHNGFFLAMIRSEFFRLLLPLGLARIVSTLALFAVTTTGLYFGALSERSREYFGFAAIAFAAWIAFRVVAYRLGENEHILGDISLLYSSCLLFALSAVFVRQSLRIVKKGAIA
ncbi:hypothetical protein [Cohnella sp. JJ-181]|uniref:hypothetical protein n=1 Tax=Cohnella rhizoplanae TaxID=2974897 RepID=UPI0022FF7065|nr:hypothetical protein [Cohnella sp. JJ-181]CAI6082802.1 hypothetical protein COHCIP112018_03767 [Cohnella sp. JJ-181]